LHSGNSGAGADGLPGRLHLIENAQTVNRIQIVLFGHILPKPMNFL